MQSTLGLRSLPSTSQPRMAFSKARTVRRECNNDSSPKSQTSQSPAVAKRRRQPRRGEPWKPQERSVQSQQFQEQQAGIQIAQSPPPSKSSFLQTIQQKRSGQIQEGKRQASQGLEDPNYMSTTGLGIREGRARGSNQVAGRSAALPKAQHEEQTWRGTQRGSEEDQGGRGKARTDVGRRWHKSNAADRHQTSSSQMPWQNREQILHRSRPGGEGHLKVRERVVSTPEECAPQPGRALSHLNDATAGPRTEMGPNGNNVRQDHTATQLDDSPSTTALPMLYRREASRGKTATFFSSESFASLGANEEMVQALAAIGIKSPSFIQAATMKEFTDDKLGHLVVADHAGSGKTLAYLIPIVQAMRAREASSGVNMSKPKQPAAVIVAPTQELCAQIMHVARALAKGGSPFRSIAATGGHKLKSQRDGLREGADVVVGTPGRLCELIKAQDLLLDNCIAVVLDEVDVLLGEGSLFQEQMGPLKHAESLTTRFVLVTASLPELTWMRLQEAFPGVRPVLGPGLHRIKEQHCNLLPQDIHSKDICQCFKQGPKEDSPE